MKNKIKTAENREMTTVTEHVDLLNEWSHAEAILAQLPNESKLKRSKAIKSQDLVMNTSAPARVSTDDTVSFSTKKKSITRIIDDQDHVYFVHETNSIEFTRSFLKLNDKVYSYTEKWYKNDEESLTSERGKRKGLVLEDKDGKKFFLKFEIWTESFYRNHIVPGGAYAKVKKIEEDLIDGYVHMIRRVDHKPRISLVKSMTLVPFEGEVDLAHLLKQDVSSDPVIISCLGVEQSIDIATFIDGEADLAHLLGQKASSDPVAPCLNADQAIAIAIQCIEAVYRLHSGLASKTGEAYIHRDIKPSNFVIHVDDDPSLCTATLVDYEFALAVKDLHQPQQWWATAAYLDPKRLEKYNDLVNHQVYSDPDFSCASDIYALGKTIQEILATINLTEKQNLSAMTQAKLTLLEQLVRGMLEYEDDSRPTAEQMHLELVQIIRCAQSPMSTRQLSMLDRVKVEVNELGCHDECFDNIALGEVSPLKAISSPRVIPLSPDSITSYHVLPKISFSSSMKKYTAHSNEEPVFVGFDVGLGAMNTLSLGQASASIVSKESVLAIRDLFTLTESSHTYT